MFGNHVARGHPSKVRDQKWSGLLKFQQNFGCSLGGLTNSAGGKFVRKGELGTEGSEIFQKPYGECHITVRRILLDVMSLCTEFILQHTYLQTVHTPLTRKPEQRIDRICLPTSV